MLVNDEGEETDKGRPAPVCVSWEWNTRTRTSLELERREGGSRAGRETVYCILYTIEYRVYSV